MTIEIICSDEVGEECSGKKIVRYSVATHFKFDVNKFVQYKCNPSSKPSMKEILDRTASFEFGSVKYGLGGITSYRIYAKDSEGNTLNTFYFLV